MKRLSLEMYDEDNGTTSLEKVLQNEDLFRRDELMDLFKSFLMCIGYVFPNDEEDEYDNPDYTSTLDMFNGSAERK
jgi:hypothetical protein